MKKMNFNVIKGGLALDIRECDKEFVSAYVTDTRLMGVLAVHACWRLTASAKAEPTSGRGSTRLHQFFYIDCEEAGLETYRCFRGDNNPEMALYQQGLVGGLGAEKVSLEQDEFRWLMNHWRQFNEKHGLALPKGWDEYEFIFDFAPSDAGSGQLTDYQLKQTVADKICVDITSDYQAVNYFLMRCFGRDYQAAACLTDLDYDFPLDIYDDYVKATFCKNTIDLEKKYADGAVSYLCESVVEMNGRHEIIVSKVVVRNLKVIGFEHCSGFPVSSFEAAMILKKPEFTSVYDVLLDEEQLEDNLGEFITGLNTVMTKHEIGRMFMAFKPTNDHVAERVFMLSNDVAGVYFLTDLGQLIVMSNTFDGINAMERRLISTPLAAYLVPSGKYEFLEPILFEFINSGFDDFEDFVDAISGDYED